MRVLIGPLSKPLQQKAVFVLQSGFDGLFVIPLPKFRSIQKQLVQMLRSVFGDLVRAAIIEYQSPVDRRCGMGIYMLTGRRTQLRTHVFLHLWTENLSEGVL